MEILEFGNKEKIMSTKMVLFDNFFAVDKNRPIWQKLKRLAVLMQKIRKFNWRRFSISYMCNSRISNTIYFIR